MPEYIHCDLQIVKVGANGASTWESGDDRKLTVSNED